MLSLIPLLFGIALAQEPTLPYDCLANVCLNAKGAPSKTAVTVSDHRWTRTIEACSGRIVYIEIKTGWEKPGFAWSDLLPGTSTKVGNLESPAISLPLGQRSVEILSEKGWVQLKQDTDDNKLSFVDYWTHQNFQGVRSTMFEMERQGRMWLFGIATVHPEYKALCRPLHSQGL